MPPSDRLRELFEAHSSEILRFIRSQLPLTPDDAQDLLQQTFMELKVELDKPERPTIENAKAYLFQIARHQLYRHIRKTKRAEELLQKRAPEAGSEAEQREVEFVTNMREDQRLLLRAMRHLPLKQQITLHLYYITDLSAPAIAQVTEQTEPAVRGQLRLGLQHIRDSVNAMTEHASKDAVETTTGTLKSWWAKLEDSVRALAEDKPEHE